MNWDFTDTYAGTASKASKYRPFGTIFAHTAAAANTIGPDPTSAKPAKQAYRFIGKSVCPGKKRVSRSLFPIRDMAPMKKPPVREV